MPKFNKGFDQDKYYDSKSVIIFDKNEKYKREGITHGLTSHAIKHIREFNYSLLKKYINDTITIIKKNKYYILSGGGRFAHPDSPLGFDMIINTLDRINDKIEQNIKLIDPEKRIYNKIIKKIEKVYKDALEKFIKSAVNVDGITDKVELEKIAKSYPIKMTLDDGKIWIYNIKNNLFCSLDLNGNVITFFRHRHNLNKILTNKNRKPINPLIMNIGENKLSRIQLYKLIKKEVLDMD